MTHFPAQRDEFLYNQSIHHHMTRKRDAQKMADNLNAGKRNTGKSASLKTSSIRSGSRPNALTDESALGRGLQMMCNALDANDLLNCGAISLPVSERSYCEIHLSISRLVTLEEPVKDGFP